MPVKVRCKGCEKVLNAPDKARGKAIKCPECGTAVRVPAESAPKKEVAKAPQSGTMLIANLDLDAVEDMQHRICPKCGSEVTAEDIECPECHVNLDTGLLSAEKKADLRRKGPNPKLYYKEFFRDGIEFWKTNKGLSFRLAGAAAVFTALFLGCLFISIWAIKPPIRVFWSFCAAIAILIPPGLAFNLHTEIIDATLRKKKKLNKYHFDKFLGAALGLKLIAWVLEIAAPLHILAIVFLVLRFWLVAAALEGGAIVFATLLFPIMMSHMAMPVTTRGWLLHKMSPAFFRTIPGVAYWCFFFYLSLLPAAGCAAAAGIFSAKHVPEFYRDANWNSAVYVTQVEIADVPKGKQIPARLQEWQEAQPVVIKYSKMYLPASLLAAAAALFGLVAVFSMRTNGLFAYYFLDRLDLETMTVEVKYVPKARNLDELERRKEMSWQPVIIALAIGFGVGASLGGSYGMNTGRGFMGGASLGMMLLGGIGVLVGFFWMLYAALVPRENDNGERLKWWSAGKFATAVLVSGIVYGSLGYLLFLSTARTEEPRAQILSPRILSPQILSQRGPVLAGMQDQSAEGGALVGSSSRQQPRSMCCLPC
jgi:hypothetical protein